MAFAAMNTVTARPEQIPDLLADIQRLGFGDLKIQPGFRHGRVYCSEDQTEVVVVTEWNNREHFIAYRQTEAGHRLVSEGLRWHPKIAFFEIVSE